jgi:type II secretory pathway pseudopilin PulG
MGAIAALEPSALRVEPGGEVTASLRVRNAGSVVDEFTFEVLGPASDWTVVAPAVLRLLPGSEERATITMRPPRSADAAAGDVPFGIKVNSKEDPSGSVVEEGVVTVAPFAEVTAELLPRTSQGSRRVRHELAVDNRGNERLNVDVIAYDEDERLEFEVADPGLVVEPGQATFTCVDARPRKRFWRGPEKTLPFLVVVQSADGIPPVTVHGTMVQRPVLPKWFWKAVLALLALLLLLLLLWFTVLRPTIESAATEAAEEAASEAAAAAVQDALAGPIAEQQAQVDDLTDKVNDVAEILGEETVAPRESTVTAPGDIRLAATDTPGGPPGTDSFTVGEGRSFAMTDIVLQNPAGNRGTLEIRRGTNVLLVVALENFRDLDYHFVAPIIFAEGESLVLALTCTEVTAVGATACSAAAYVSGQATGPAPTPTETST